MDIILKALSETFAGINAVTGMIGIKNIDLGYFPEWAKGHYMMNKRY